MAASGDPIAPATSAARILGAGHSFETGANTQSRNHAAAPLSLW
jgi:hypothetical protein